ncbi:MAG: C25 family cysteine peptidase, partial [Chloroflexota bacterium]
MKTIRSSHVYGSVLQVMLVVTVAAAMLFQIASPARASGLWNLSAPGAQNSIEQGKQSSMAGKDRRLKVTASDPQGITVELSASDFTIEEKIVDGQACQVIRIEDFGATETPGWPELPVQGAMLGIPAQSDPALMVIEAKPVVLKGKYQLCPVEQPTQDQILPGDFPPSETKPARDAQAYKLSKFWPDAAVELSSTAYLRDQRVAQLRIYPFQYNAASGELRYYSRIVVRFNYNKAQKAFESTSPTPTADVQEPAFESLLQDTLINYQEATEWRVENSSNASELSNMVSTLQPAYKLFVDQDGLYQVTYDALATVAGDELSPGQAANSFRLFTDGDYTRGQEVAIEVLDGADGGFHPGDAILFYGQKVNTRYAGENVYFLTWGGAEGMRMAVKDSAPTDSGDIASFKNIQHLEVNKLYLSNNPSATSNDIWYWDYIQNAGSKTYTTTLTSIAAGTTNTARIRGSLRSYSASPRHHTRIYLNGYLIDDALWNFLTTYVFDKEVPQTYLLEGVNTITVEALLDNGITASLALINWFEIDYWDAFVADNDTLTFKAGGNGSITPQISAFSTDQLDVLDITDPNSPERLANVSIEADSQGYNLLFEGNSTMERVYIAQAQARRLSPQRIERDSITNLHAAANGADYIIISHADFLAAAQPLANWRASQGLRTFVVDVADVYDEFGGGLMSPKAIHDFLAYTYANWQVPAPLYIVLIGDGNYDPRNYLGYGTKTFIPPYMEFVDHWVGENASENRFVTVSGNDYLPDMFIGRLPVSSLAQANNAVSKILAYEQNPPAANLNSNVLFIADNADGAGDFVYYSEKVVNGYLPANYNPLKVYYGTTHTTVASARTAILSGFNNGALIVNYVGHGSVQTWASENLFSTNSVATLTNNATLLPFVNSMSCLTSSFTYPNFNGIPTNSLAEQLVLSANGGAIATFASAGLGLASGQDYLNRGLFQAVFQENRTQVGSAATRAKLYLYANTGGYQDAIDLFHVLGDPATRLHVLPVPPASLGDRVWEDANANGVQEAEESGLPGVSVNLYSADGNQIGSAVTDPQGAYFFDGLQPGSYYLIFSNLVGYTYSPLNPSAGADLDSDANPASGKSAGFTLGAGQQDLSHDAGVFRLASLG